jgi:hypothetical protein
MKTIVALITMASAGAALATLPPASPEAKAKSAETAAKTAWSDKVGAYKTCVAQDKVAETYRASLKGTGREVPKPVATAPCTDPGPFVTPITPVASKPLEASGAHSPPGTATSPPSTNTPAAGTAKN